MCLGIPGKVIEIWDESGTRMSTVDFGGTTKTVCLAYLPDMEIGEYTIASMRPRPTRPCRCSPTSAFWKKNWAHEIPRRIP
jgi:hypothetical protein